MVLRYSTIEEKQKFDTNCFITETWTSACAKTLTFCLVKTWFVLDLWFHCFCFSLLHSYVWLLRLFINFDAYLCYGLKDFCPPEFKCWNLGHKMISGSGGVGGSLGNDEDTRAEDSWMELKTLKTKSTKASRAFHHVKLQWKESSAEAGSLQTPNLLQLWFCSSSFQNCEKWVYCLEPPSLGMFFKATQKGLKQSLTFSSHLFFTCPFLSYFSSLIVFIKLVFEIWVKVFATN